MEYFQTDNENKYGCKFMTSCVSGNIEFIKQNINNFDCLKVNSTGDNCITLSAKNKREDVLEILIESKKFELKRINNDDKDLLNYVLENELVNIFEKYKHVFKLFDLTRYKYVYGKNLAYIKMFINLGLELPNDVLVVEAKNGDIDKIKFLIEAGINPDLKDICGITALMQVSDNGRINVFEMLIQVGAKLDLQSNLGLTALMFASCSGRIREVESLIKAGASLDLKDGYGRTALTHALDNGHIGIVKLLKKSGAKNSQTCIIC